MVDAAQQVLEDLYFTYVLKPKKGIDYMAMYAAITDAEPAKMEIAKALIREWKGDIADALFLSAQQRKQLAANTELAMNLAEHYHHNVKRLYSSKHSRIVPGTAREVEDWKCYSKNWHRAHGPARYKVAGVTLIDLWIVVLHPIRGKSIKLDLCAWIDSKEVKEIK